MERIVVLSIKVKMNVEEGLTDIDGIINDLDYSVAFNGDEATIIDTEMEDYKIRK